MTINNERRWILVLLVFSFTVYLMFGLLFRPSDPWQAHEGTGFYIDCARQLAAGDGLCEPHREMPLYSMMLAGMLVIFGEMAWPILFFQAGTGVLTTFFTYKIGRLLFSPAVGLLAGLLITLHPYLVKLSMQLMDTGPAIATFILAMWLFLRAWLNPKVRPSLYALAGAVFAVSTLVRAVAGVVMIMLAGVLFLWLLYHKQVRQAFLATLALVLAWGIIMSPWWVYNYGKYGHFIPLHTNGGSSLAQGHNPGFTAGFEALRTYNVDHVDYFDRIARPPDDPSGYYYNQATTRQALDYIKAHPVEALITDLKKITMLFTWHKVPRTMVNSQPRWDPVLMTVVDDGNPRLAPQEYVYILYWVPLMLSGLVGLILSFRHWQNLLPIYVAIIGNNLVSMLAVAHTRYRLEIDPFIAVFAAYAVITVAIYLYGRMVSGSRDGAGHVAVSN
jgi:4-amino-4-deoxy-L-arabinose transferase-like glycosyltransferase